ncbi:MAG TPA: DEAD/DEAH box helicase family protein [Ktedonobacterales bacterium]|nr:DEAD/DEAH box helicase family protein [Ktedonobacterales bacterium]
MKPEAQARQQIDALLTQAGWVVQEVDRFNLGAARGVAIAEFPLSTGPTDYLLVVDRQAVGVVEAKKVGETLTGVEVQSAKYREGRAGALTMARVPLPFAYESTGVETRFTNDLDPEPRSRPVFAFHQPETLAEWLAQAPAEGDNHLMRSLLLRLPALPTTGLRDCQFEAITHLEESFQQNRPRALVQMATGSGKTYMAVSSVYRLIKFGGARRVLFLVDRSNLGRQTLKEFEQYVTPDDGRKFTELYNVQHLQSNHIDPVARVCISTIQRLYSILSGEPDLDPTLEEGSLFDLDSALAAQPPKQVLYNPQVPIETFDVIITDECHRSIYHLWRGVLEYFDAFTVGLTATPNKQTFGFFHGNLVMEYGHERAVADGVNVDYQVYRIRTAITERGSTIERGYYVDKRDRLTRAKRWEQVDEEISYTAAQLDRDVVTPDQIRTLIRAYKEALITDLFPNRTEVPKTLIFAKDDSHADDIVQIVREEFGRGNDFAQKITYRTTGVKPEDLIASFRNSYYPRIAVTVDMIATGTDVKPLEVLLFMRSVRSRGFFEQMKGRGTRTISDDDFQAVTPDARSKDHFVLVDAIGVCERLKTDEPSLERKRSVPFDKLLTAVALGNHDEDTLLSLAGRLGRLGRKMSLADEKAVMQQADGLGIRDLAEALIAACDPDQHLEIARQATGQKDPDEQAIQKAARLLMTEVAAPFDNPDLRTLLVDIQRRDEQLIDTVSQDQVVSAGWDAHAEEQARQTITNFRQFIEDHRDEITALQVLYSSPRHAVLRLKDLKQLAQTILAPPLGLTTDKLWHAYERLDGARVQGASTRRLLTDLVALVRYTLAREQDEAVRLEPYAEGIRRRFAIWLEEQEQQRGQPFTPEQRQWLELMREHVATSLTIEPADFDNVPFSQRGGLGKAYQVFGQEFPAMLKEINERLVA